VRVPSLTKQFQIAHRLPVRFSSTRRVLSPLHAASSSQVKRPGRSQQNRSSVCVFRPPIQNPQSIAAHGVLLGSRAARFNSAAARSTGGGAGPNDTNAPAPVKGPRARALFPYATAPRGRLRGRFPPQLPAVTTAVVLCICPWLNSLMPCLHQSSYPNLIPRRCWHMSHQGVCSRVQVPRVEDAASVYGYTVHYKYEYTCRP